MSEKRSKYDTDPLDPDFVRRTEEFGSAARETARTPNEQARLNPDADAPTRRIDDHLSQPYPSIFVPPAQTPPPPPPAYQQPTYQQPTYQQPTYQQPTYQQPTHANLGRTAPMAGVPQRPAPPTSRTVAGLGIPENIALVLPYVPFYIGIVGAIIELLLVPRTETRVRFHAAQGLALQLAILIVSLILGFLGDLSGVGLGRPFFSIAANIFLVVSIIRVWKGETHHLAPLDEATSWLYERIEPRK
ncbi:MAG TPA: hypothetical protein VGX24_12180 [Pyrinomonadaceae bacterium]|jgi:uncharacterized membrane protein|nr:hypothetical protein [Pyrinomonadaceae bacterium]